MGRINVRLDPDLKAELQAAALAAGVRPSDVVRAALREHLRAYGPRRSCLDIARRIGLVGSIEGTPTDLSTNRAHFEGFGAAGAADPATRG